MKTFYNNGIFGGINVFEESFFALVHHNDNHMDVESLEKNCFYFYLEDDEGPEGCK